MTAKPQSSYHLTTEVTNDAENEENKSPTSALDGQDVVKIEGLELLKDNEEAKTASKDEKGSRESPVGSDAGDSKIKEKISVSSGTPEDDGDTILEYPNHRITDEIIQKVCQGMELEELGGSLLGVAGATVAPTEQYLSSQQSKD